MQSYQVLYSAGKYQVISRNNGGSGMVEIWKETDNKMLFVCSYDNLETAKLFVNSNLVP